MGNVIVGGQWGSTMVFHGDYEIEFEIYAEQPNDWRNRFLGYAVGTDASDAKLRWIKDHQVPSGWEWHHKILALPSLEEWK